VKPSRVKLRVMIFDVEGTIGHKRRRFLFPQVMLVESGPFIDLRVIF